MPRFTVLASVFDKNGNETQKRVPVDAADSSAALASAQATLGAQYEQVYVKEVRAPQENPIVMCKQALKADPGVKRPETFAALKAYFAATGQAWLSEYLSG